MAFSKTPPLEERIKSICAEAEAVVEAKAIELKKQCDSLPSRGSLETWRTGWAAASASRLWP